MKKLLSILLAVVMVMVFALPVMAIETAEPELYADAYDMTYYVGGYGAMPNRYQCGVKYPEEGYADWFDISFGDPIVESWPTKAGTYTVNFEKKTTIEGAGDTVFSFSVSMNITVLELPATSGKCGDNMTWSFDTKTDTLTISGAGDMYTVAASIDDLWNENFIYKPGWWKLPIKHVVVEEGVENLSNFAFATDNGYYELHETIQLPSTLKAIPEFGFLFSTAMKSLVIPEGITSLTGWPFGSPGNSFTALTDLYLPSTLTEMDITTVMLSGLDNRTAAQTLKTIHFAGTEEQWNAIKYVESESIKELFGDDYEVFYENWCEPFKDIFAKLEIVYEYNKDISIENGTATIPDSSIEINVDKDVVIDVTDTEEKVSSVVISPETVDKIAEAEVSVAIKLPDAIVSFDKAAMGSISKQAGTTSVTIVAVEANNTTLTDEQKASLKEKEVCAILNLEAFAGTTKITEFGGGKVKVSIPFTLPVGKFGTNYYVAYVADNGAITAMPTTYADGVLSFETTHFSNYVVLEKKDVTSQPDPTGDNSCLFLLTVVALVSTAGMGMCITKRRFF